MKPKVGEHIMYEGKEYIVLEVYDVERAIDIERVSDGRTFRLSGLGWIND